ncbi:MAG: LemA family protein [Pseudomonadota bacterium]|nr:LemA family protein [Pseudomonadota bacterium]
MEYLPIAVVIAVVALLYFWYAGIVSKRNKARESLSGIDVQLKKRSNLIPNVLTIAKRFMEHEKELLTGVTELRTRADSDYNVADPDAVKEHLQAASALGSQMGRLMIAVEAYPDLKSDETMLQAQRTYSEVEAQIAAARRFYNASVTRLNNAIEIFPGNLLAGLAHAKVMPFYEADEESKRPVDASSFLN